MSRLPAHRSVDTFDVPSLERNAGYATGVTLVRLSLSLAAVPVLARSLGLARFGVWAVLLSIFGISALFQLGVGPALSVQVAVARSARHSCDIGEILGTSLTIFSGLAVTMAFVVFVTANPVAGWLFHEHSLAVEAGRSLQFLGIATLFQFAKQWLMAAESGFQRYDVQAWAEGIGAVLLNGGLIAVALSGHGLVALTAWLAFATLATLFMHAVLWRMFVTTGSPLTVSSTRARDLLHFGLRQGISQLGTSLFGLVDKVIVNVVLGQTAAGLYSAATSVAMRINEISAAPLQTIAPAMADSHTAAGMKRVRTIYYHAEKLNLCFAFSLATLVMVFAGPIAVLLVPTEQTPTASVLRILAFAYGIYSLNAVGFFAAQGMGQPGLNAIWVLLAATVFIPCVWAGAQYGLKTAAWANVAYVLTLGINLSVRRTLGGRFGEFALLYGAYVAALIGSLLVSSYVVAEMTLRGWLIFLVLGGAICGATFRSAVQSIAQSRTALTGLASGDPTNNGV